MKKYLDIYQNWRMHVLTILTMLAIVLTLSDSESIAVLIFTKIVGFVLAVVIYCLAEYWDEEGKVNELHQLINE